MLTENKMADNELNATNYDVVDLLNEEDIQILSDLQFYESLHHVVVPVIFCLIIVLGVTGNIVVIIATVCRQKSRSSLVGLLLLNLASSDLLFLTVCVPFMAYHYVTDNWRLGTVVCKLAQYTLYVTVYVTVYTLVAVAIIRSASCFIAYSPSRVGCLHLRMVKVYSAV